MPPSSPVRSFPCVQDADGQEVCLGERLAADAEAQIYTVRPSADLVAKLYEAPSPQHTARLAALIARPPREPAGDAQLCWPQRPLFRRDRPEAAGFLMRRADVSALIPLSHLCDPALRQAQMPACNWRFLLKTAAGMAALASCLHERGYGLDGTDLRRFLAGPRGNVTRVGCDSLDVPGGGPREDDPGDRFELGVLIFQVLMEGVHPFDALWQGLPDSRSLQERIGAADSAFTGTPPLEAPPLAVLPPALRALFRRCFEAGLRTPAERPSALEWQGALDVLEGELTSCGVNPRHVYPQICQSCPWCERVRLGGPDPFPAPPAQQALQPTAFVGPAAGDLPHAVRASVLHLQGRLRRGALLLCCGLLAALGVSLHAWTRPASPEEERREQEAHIRTLIRQRQMISLRDYLHNTALLQQLEDRSGTKTRAAQSFVAVRPAWTPADSPGCEVRQGTLLEIKSYIDNNGYFAANRYSAVVSLPPQVCPGSKRLIIAPMSALPAEQQLLDCPGRGGRLAGFAWHSTEDWSCAARPGPDKV